MAARADGQHLPAPGRGVLGVAAQGGEILVADVVRQLTKGKDFLFADRGETELRSFEDPVRLYGVGWREEG